MFCWFCFCDEEVLVRLPTTAPACINIETVFVNEITESICCALWERYFCENVSKGHRVQRQCPKVSVFRENNLSSQAIVEYRNQIVWSFTTCLNIFHIRIYTSTLCPFSHWPDFFLRMFINTFSNSCTLISGFLIVISHCYFKCSPIHCLRFFMMIYICECVHACCVVFFFRVISVFYT